MADNKESGHKGPLSIHIPEPPGRPGDKPDFSHIKIPKAGETRCPDLDTKAEDMRDMAYSIVRVLDRKGNAVGPWAEYLGDDLTDETLLRGLKDMMVTRAFDQRMQTAQRQGKTSFYVQCTGEEAIATGFQRMMRPGDMNFPTYRQQGLLIAAECPLIDMMNQIYSNEKDPLDGKQLPALYSFKDHGFFTISGNLGTQYVQAVGWAMASAISGDDKISSAWIGDGSTAETDFHSGMLFASVYKPPVVLNIVNNQWAISSSNAIAGSQNTTFAARALGYGFPSIRVDGNDYLAVLAASKWATERARRNLGPTLIEWVTYRVAAHSTSDDPTAYRPQTESDAWPLGDPIERLKLHLIANSDWTEERHTQAKAEIESEIIRIQKEAESHGTLNKGHGPDAEMMFEGVYKEMPEHLVRQRIEFEKQGLEG
ncbi:3-methyl-2-oxobutanoate dehydrogenase (2-methylpropanoyl-transferring) subunit alpha [Maritalea porphyrae]|uniref:2-oxoisovalerate dehydrogenase subunit alpha n=1 Tax=Maritalea porphyrae TaxID=880732 RepID=A0ABQ5URS9_9HYPH|nr:3-methyl-2-oxobutanoate dehydrogenase (2-methylpropanoyl-transferring) subunit alpha [Maritalea porphyrae]GLQ17030.1 3-methyl-2-oxobutanoate dehydrogenase (2-methylpropanoyl-transferring) subunit alpha [Maritalea porphyrae]